MMRLTRQASAERQRLSNLTLEHTVPFLRYALRWNKEGSVENFAGSLLATQQQILFELANKG